MYSYVLTRVHTHTHTHAHDTGASAPWRDGRRAGSAVTGRARDADDAQHVPLCRRLCEERDAGCAAATGDHQRVEKAEDSAA